MLRTLLLLACLLAAIALIPLLYLMRRWITRYLGAARARELREQAAS